MRFYSKTADVRIFACTLMTATLTMRPESAKERAHNLLVSAFSSSLNVSVVTYDQYNSNPDDAYYQPLDINQLFSISHLTRKIGEPAQTLTGKTISVQARYCRRKIEDAEGMLVHVQHLGKQLQDDTRDYKCSNTFKKHPIGDTYTWPRPRPQASNYCTQ